MTAITITIPQVAGAIRAMSPTLRDTTPAGLLSVSNVASTAGAKGFAGGRNAVIGNLTKSGVPERRHSH